MNVLFVSEYCEIYFSPGDDAVVLIWLPENRRMSEPDFKDQLEALINTIEIYKPRIVYIDAFEFNYPILNHSINRIIHLLNNVPVEIYGVLNSRHLLGYLVIKRLIAKIDRDVRVVFFTTLKDRKLRLAELVGMNVCKL